VSGSAGGRVMYRRWGRPDGAERRARLDSVSRRRLYICCSQTSRDTRQTQTDGRTWCSENQNAVNTRRSYILANGQRNANAEADENGASVASEHSSYETLSSCLTRVNRCFMPPRTTDERHRKWSRWADLSDTRDQYRLDDWAGEANLRRGPTYITTTRADVKKHQNFGPVARMSFKTACLTKYESTTYLSFL